MSREQAIKVKGGCYGCEEVPPGDGGAATCQAGCPAGTSASCSGHSCNDVIGIYGAVVGIKCYNSSGQQTAFNLCG